MARPLYSTQFLLGSPPAHTPLTYTVPDGFVAVVRDIDWSFTDKPGSDDLAYWFVTNSGVACYVVYQTPQIELASGNLQWRGRQVVTAGQSITVSATTDFNVIVSGYLLTAP